MVPQDSQDLWAQPENMECRAHMEQKDYRVLQAFKEKWE
jgi:hypothetical protein